MPCGDRCVNRTRQHGRMRSKSIGHCGPGCAAFVARCICIDLACRSMTLICPPPPTGASSICGRMSARVCVVYEAGSVPITFEPITRDELNAHLILWRHKMGEIRHPTRGWSHGLRHEGRLLAVAGLTRHDAIELSRLCAAKPDLCRVALRLWRSFVFPAIAAARGCRWAVSYQDAVFHSRNLYRFDGWVTLGRSRGGTDSRFGRRGRRKVIWGWCDDPQSDGTGPSACRWSQRAARTGCPRSTPRMASRQVPSGSPILPM